MRRVRFSELEFRSEADLAYLDGELFSGIAYELAPEGWLDEEVSYRDGMPWGKARVWYGPGTIEAQLELVRGVRHGIRRGWNERGGTIAEEAYAYGLWIWGKYYDDEGRLIAEERLPDTDPGRRRMADERSGFERAGIAEDFYPVPDLTEFWQCIDLFEPPFDQYGNEIVVRSAEHLAEVFERFAAEKPRLVVVRSPKGERSFVGIGGKFAGMDHRPDLPNRLPREARPKRAYAKKSHWFWAEGDYSEIEAKFLMPPRDVIDILVHWYKTGELADWVEWE